jgi:hypothetical protein
LSADTVKPYIPGESGVETRLYDHADYPSQAGAVKRARLSFFGHFGLVGRRIYSEYPTEQQGISNIQVNGKANYNSAKPQAAW